MMTDDAKDFYAEGCDASSYIIVPAENEIDQVKEKVFTATEPNEVFSMIVPTISTGVEHADGWREFLAQVKRRHVN